MSGTPDGSFTQTFMRLMLVRIALALAAMGLSYAGTVLGETTGTTWGPFVGGVIGLVIGVAALVWIIRRRPDA